MPKRKCLRTIGTLKKAVGTKHLLWRTAMPVPSGSCLEFPSTTPTLPFSFTWEFLLFASMYTGSFAVHPEVDRVGFGKQGDVAYTRGCGTLIVSMLSPMAFEK